MRKVNRSRNFLPQILQGKEVRTALQKIFDYYDLPEEIRAGRRIPTDGSLIDRDPDLIESLQSVFFSKCGYCESLIGRERSGTIDRFRPISNARNTNNKKESHDHYGWFIFEWQNLILSCGACNRVKRNFFPVKGARAPLLSTWSEAIQVEEQTILDPCEDDPYSHLIFDSNGQCIHTSKRGEITISILDLNRPDLVENRKIKINQCLAAMEVIRDGKNEPITILSELLTEGSEFSGVLGIYLYSVGLLIAEKFDGRIPRKKRLAEDLIALMKFIPLDVNLSDLAFEVNQNVGVRPILFSEDSIRMVAGSAYEKIVKRTATSKIEKIILSNFKGIENLSIDLKAHGDNFESTPCLSLLGENSTGKTSVLQAVALCLMGQKLRNQLKLDPEEFLSREPNGWSLSGRRVAKIYIEFEDGEFSELTIDPILKRFEGNEIAAAVVLAYGARRYFDPSRKQARTIDSISSLFNPQSAVAHPAAWLSRIDDGPFQAVARAMRAIFTLRDDDLIKRNQEGVVFIRAHGRDTPIERLSEGYKTLFAMTVDIAREMVKVWGSLEEARGVVLIDEIETHLHPRWKIKVMAGLRAAMPKVQFITTTHDPLCLRGLAEGEAQVLYRNEIESIEVLSELPNVKYLRTEQLLTSDYFGLASSSSEEGDALLDEYAALAGHSSTGLSDDKKQRRSYLGEMLEENIVIGDNAVDQIAVEAARQYLEERSKVELSLRNELRKEAVAQVLSALNEKFG